MRLSERLADYKRRQEAGQVPPITTEHLNVMYRATDDLIGTGQHERTLKVGETFPDFELPDESGKLVSSEPLLAAGPLVVVFYRGIWCDYCNFELEALEEVYPRIRELGAELVGVSPVTMPGLRAAIRRNQLSFRLLGDRGNSYARRFNIVYRLSDELQTVWRSFGMDFTKINGDDSLTLPMPAVYVAGPDHVVRFAEVHPDYWNRAEPEEVVAVLERLITES
ncbi:MAG: peroxiredoxin-like family protein [Micromonosporaceae bacterium]